MKKQYFFIIQILNSSSRLHIIIFVFFTLLFGNFSFGQVDSMLTSSGDKPFVLKTLSKEDIINYSNKKTKKSRATAKSVNTSVYKYLGSFKLGDGPCWTSAPPTYTAREAAAFIFGGEPSDYAISVNSNTTDESTITHTAWLDGWGDITYLNTPTSEDFKQGTDYIYPAFSAFVKDHSDGNNHTCGYEIRRERINYVWKKKISVNSCPQNIVVALSPGNCTARVDNLDPVVVPIDAPYNYTLSGATSGFGNGTASGLAFNAGKTFVTYTSDGNNTSICSFTVTVNDDEKPVIKCPSISHFVKSTDEGQCTYKINGTEFDVMATDNCSIASLVWNITGATINAGNDSVDGIDLNFGINTINWIATDFMGNKSTCSIEVIVDKIKTSTNITVTPNTQQYSDKVSFQASVVPYNCTVKGNIGGKVIFKIGDLVMGESSIDADGVATLSNIPLLEDMLYDADLNNPFNPTDGPLKPGLKTVTALFSGTDSDYIVSNPTTDLTITCENAEVIYNSESFFGVNPDNLSGTVILSDYIRDEDDVSIGARGDIRNATVTFRSGAVNGPVLGFENTPVGLVNPENKQEGFAATSFTTTLSEEEAANGGKVFSVYSVLSNYYCGNNGPTTVTLAVPGKDFVNGGGQLILGDNSAGTYAGASGKQMNFGFHMKWDKSQKNIKGEISIIYRSVVAGVTKIYQIKNNSINSLIVENVDYLGEIATGSSIKFRKAIFVSKVNLTDITNPLNPISLGKNFDLIMTAWESTTVNKGELDRVSVQLSGSGSTGLLFSNNWSGIKTTWQTISGGKIQIHNLPETPATLNRKNVPTEDLNVSGQQSKFNVKAYPNPSNNQFIIEIENESDIPTNIYIYDMVGQLLYRELEINSKKKITFGDNLPRGIYILKVHQGGSLKNFRLIKE